MPQESPRFQQGIPCPPDPPHSIKTLLRKGYPPPSLTLPLPVAVLLVFLLAASISGCLFESDQDPPPGATQVSPTATVPAEPGAASTSTALPAGTAAVPRSTPSASGLVLPVSIAEVQSDLPQYDRQTWRHWIDEDSDCQNARQEVLIIESTVAVTYQSDERCRVATGVWVGPYTGTTVDDPGDLDVDHMVPLGNAHRSGAWNWDRERKREYANYLGYEDHLIATTSGANRSKGSKGPEEWRPPFEQYWCDYAVDWVTIKNEWGLTVTEAEYIALTEMLATCEMTVLLQPTQGMPPPSPVPTAAVGPQTVTPPSPVPTAPASPQTATPTDLRYDPFGPDRNCGDFDNYEEALAFFRAAGGPEADPHRLDSNGDGQPCETLPGGPSAEVQTAGPGLAASSVLGEGDAVEEDPVCAGTGPLGSGSTHLLATPVAGSEGIDCDPLTAPAAHIVLSPASTPTLTLTPTPTPANAPSPTPSPSPRPDPGLSVAEQTPVPAVNCSDFSNWRDAQDFFLSEGGPAEDPHGLDRNDDGVSCQSLPGAPDDDAAPNSPTPTPASPPEGPPISGTTPVLEALAQLPYDPSGPDRDCVDFTSWWDAQNFYLAAGGPDQDPHSLDHNGDGSACESLSGAPTQVSEPSLDEQATPALAPEIEDRNCADFSNWSEAQAFYLAAGGPNDDPHGLDHNGDGSACESLSGAPTQVSEPSLDEQATAALAPEIEDRNCADFSNWSEAQAFYLAAGGPDQDPHGLDRNKNGEACESLPGAPDDEPDRVQQKAQPTPAGQSPTEENVFRDRNCGDFKTWQEAQNLFVSQGGPSQDPHRLDRDKDGIVCESLPGAPE